MLEALLMVDVTFVFNELATASFAAAAGIGAAALVPAIGHLSRLW